MVPPLLHHQERREAVSRSRRGDDAKHGHVQVRHMRAYGRIPPPSGSRPDSNATQLATGLGVPHATDHWQVAEALLANQLVGFDRRAWSRACAHHGPRAALAVIETALVVRIRGGTDNPIRSAPAYLGGILRKRRGDCRPEVTLAALAARSEHQQRKENAGCS